MLGGKAKEPPDEGKAEEPVDPFPDVTLDSDDVELARLGRFRAQGLLEEGFSIEEMLRIVHIPDVVHTAEDLLRRKWPHHWIVDSLAPPKDDE